MKTAQRLSRQLYELSNITPDGEATRRAIHSTRAAVLGAFAESHSQQRIGDLLWPRRAAALVAGAVALIGIGLAVISFTSPQFAFADIVKQVQAVKSVRYIESHSHVPRPGELHGPTVIKNVAILGRSRMREEYTSVTPGEPLSKGDEWYADDSAVGTLIITDLARGKVATLDTKNKTFSYVQQFATMSPDDGKISTSKLSPAPEVNFFKDLKLLPAEKAERLAAREVGGHQVIGFRSTEKIQRKNGVETWTRIYWVDPNSRLPRQIEVTSKSTDPNMGQSRWVLSEIVFDQPIDESLFSTELPAGYRAQE